MKEFKNLVQQYFGPLSPPELSVIQAYFREERLTKNAYFTQSGQVCDKLSLVKTGLFRIYSITPEGKEITQWISPANSLITEIQGFFYSQANRWSIQALADAELLTISKTNYLKLSQEIPAWNRIERGFLVKCFATLEERVFTHLALSAEERYTLYFEKNKELFTQVPLQYIASLLGMSAETFSRIRNKQTPTS